MSPDIAAFVQKLAAWGRRLTAEERDALAATISEVMELSADTDFIREGERRETSNLLLSGWTCRYNGLPNGRTQIVALHIPGDFIDLHSYQLKEMDHSVRTLTACRVAIVPHANLDRLTEHHPHLTRQLWLSTLIDAAILRQLILGLGQRIAAENAAHLFCEMFARLGVVGLTEANRYRLPLNQTELGNLLGISAVHTNRVLQDLRRRRLLTLEGEWAGVPDLEALQDFCAFDPTYLHIQSR